MALPTTRTSTPQTQSYASTVGHTPRRAPSIGEHSEANLRHGQPSAKARVDTIGSAAGADAVVGLDKLTAKSPIEDETKALTPEQWKAAIQQGPTRPGDDARSGLADALLGDGALPGQADVDLGTDPLNKTVEHPAPDFGPHLGEFDREASVVGGFETGTPETHPGMTNPRATAGDDDDDSPAPSAPEEKSGWEAAKEWLANFFSGAASGAAGAAKTTSAGTVAGSAATVLTTNGTPEAKGNEFKGWAALLGLSKGQHPHKEQLDQVEGGLGKIGEEKPNEDRDPDSVDPGKIKIDFNDPNWIIKTSAKRNENIQHADMPENGSSNTSSYDGIDYGAGYTEPENIPDDALAWSIWDDPAVDPNRS